MQNYSDEQLIANYLAGDRENLEILIRRYLRMIFAFVHKYLRDKQDVEDVTQEVFVKMWRNIKKFDSEKNFKSWLFSIAKNSCIDFLRKKERLSRTHITLVVSQSLPPQEIIEQKRKNGIFSLALSKLSDEYKKVLQLRFVDDLSFREIANMLKEPLHTVKSRSRRGILKLKALLAEEL